MNYSLTTEDIKTNALLKSNHDTIFKVPHDSRGVYKISSIHNSDSGLCINTIKRTQEEYAQAWSTYVYIDKADESGIYWSDFHFLSGNKIEGKITWEAIYENSVP